MDHKNILNKIYYPYTIKISFTIYYNSYLKNYKILYIKNIII